MSMEEQAIIKPLSKAVITKSTTHYMNEGSKWAWFILLWNSFLY